MDARIAPTTRSAQFGVMIQPPAGGRSNGPFYDSFLAGLEETLDLHGASVFVQMAGSRAEEIETYPRWARERLVDAAVLVDPVQDDPRLGVCAGLGIPVVVLGEGVRGAQASIVEVDNASAMHTAVEFLFSLGHRAFGRVSGPADLLHTRSRTAAFDAAVRAGGGTGSSVEGDYGAQSGARCTRELLDLAPRPTAIIFDNDVMAVAGLEVATECQVDVPGRLSLLAWDDSALCRLAEPPLSVVSRDAHEFGVAVAGALLRIRSVHVSSVVHTAKARVFARGTTGPAPAAG